MLMDESVYLAHYGKKGMKWGVRRANKNTARLQKRIDRTSRIAKGNASVGDRLLGSAITKKGADRQLQRYANNQAKLSREGKHRVSKKLLQMQGVKYKELNYGGKKGDANAKMDNGQKAAIAGLAAYGAIQLLAVAKARSY